MSALAVGEHGRKPLACASINQALSAVIFYHRNAGYPFDRKHPVIARTWAGISRTKAKTETVRKAKPLLACDLRDLIEKLRPDVPIAARDAALLSLGWAGALRRSELVGLDWHQLGAGTGFLVIDERGIAITLMTSKASQDAAEEVVIPNADMPAACRALGAWASVAALEPGQPVFRPIDQHGHISAERLTGRSVAQIVKVRMRRLEHRRGKTRKKRQGGRSAVLGAFHAGALCHQRRGQGHAGLSHPGAHAPTRALTWSTATSAMQISGAGRD